MANIRLDLDSPVINGQTLTFRSPIDCSNVTGLIAYYKENGVEISKTFQFADAHGNNVGSFSLFAENVLVKVIVDTELSRAYVQNADTNAYLEARLENKAPAGYIDSFYEYAGLDDAGLDKLLLNIATNLESGKQHRCIIHVNRDDMTLERGYWFFEITRKVRDVQIQGRLGSKSVYRTFSICSNLVHNITSSAFNFGNDTDGDGKADYFGEDLNPPNTWMDKNASAFIPFSLTQDDTNRGYVWAREKEGWFYYPMRGTNLYKLHPAYQNYDNTAPWEWTPMCAGIAENAYLNTTQSYIICDGLVSEPYFTLKLRVYEKGRYNVKIDTGEGGIVNLHLYLIPESKIGNGNRNDLTNDTYKLGIMEPAKEKVKEFEVELAEPGYYYLVTSVEEYPNASVRRIVYLKTVTLSLDTDDGDVGGTFSEWARSDAVIMPGTGVDSLVQRTTEPGNSGNDPTNRATARGGAAFGRYNKVYAKEGFASGTNNTVGEEGDPETGRNGFAVNSTNNIQGKNGAGFGHHNEIPKTYPKGGVENHPVEAAFVTGMYNKAVRSAQFVGGMFCKPNVDALLILGNGTEGDTSNALEILDDGTLVVGGMSFHPRDAAPSGYGLGGEPTKIINSFAALDNVTEIGWYRLNCPGHSLNGFHFNYASVRVSNIHDSVYQELQPSCDLTILRRVMDNHGNWTGWHFENPPMFIGREYCTTERWNGKPVFTKLVDFGILPNGATGEGWKEVSFSDENVRVISYDGFAETEADGGLRVDKIPMRFDEGELGAWCEGSSICFFTELNYTNYHAYFTVKYTKG